MQLFLCNLFILAFIPNLLASNLKYETIKFEYQEKGKDRKQGIQPQFKLLIASIVPEAEAEADAFNKESIKNILDAAISDLIKTKKNEVDGISVKFYQSKSHLKEAHIGEAEWWPKGHSFSYSNRENVRNKNTHVKKVSVFTVLQKTSKVAKRLSKETRKEIFRDIVMSQDEARKIADNKQGPL